MKDEYQCPVQHCLKVYRNMFNLRRHLDVVHIGIYRHKCKICSKPLTRKQYLKEHMYTHTGEKPYSCPFSGCAMKFRQRSQLSIHKKEHYHSGTYPNEVVVEEQKEVSRVNEVPLFATLPPLRGEEMLVKIPSISFWNC